jgi:hypothetical protein
MTDRERAVRVELLVKGALFPYRLRPHSPRYNEIVRLLEEIGRTAPPPPPPPPSTERYAPRAYNTAPNGSDARFCMSSSYGVEPNGSGFVDARGVTYDEGGRDLGGRTKLLVPELKPANEMDDRDVCDPYVGPTGRQIGGAAGYPDASFER